MASPNPDRIRPLDAWRAMRTLLRNPDDTARVFDIIDALSGRSGLRQYERFRRTPTGARIFAEKRDLLSVLSDREALMALPAGTLGRAYAEFMRQEQISAEGLVEASETPTRAEVQELPPERRLFGSRLRDMHDLWHVVTGYGRDLVGEASLLAFTYSQTQNRGIGFIVLMAYLRANGDFSVARPIIREGFRRGRKAEWLPGQDWEALLSQPLEKVRADLRVGAPPAYAAVLSEAGAAAAAA